MKTVLLTQGKFAQVDDADFKKVSRFKWYAQKVHHQWYALRGTWIGRKSGKVCMHRFVLDAVPGTQIDHVDGDGLNNTRRNLRFCTTAQNSRNSTKHRTRGLTSKYKGVSWHKPSKKWVAHIGVRNKLYHLGLFSDELDAARAYDKAAVKMFGKFARPNFSVPSRAVRRDVSKQLEQEAQRFDEMVWFSASEEQDNRFVSHARELRRLAKIARTPVPVKIFFDKSQES